MSPSPEGTQKPLLQSELVEQGQFTSPGQFVLLCWSVSARSAGLPGSGSGNSPVEDPGSDEVPGSEEVPGSTRLFRSDVVPGSTEVPGSGCGVVSAWLVSLDGGEPVEQANHKRPKQKARICFRFRFIQTLSYVDFRANLYRYTKGSVCIQTASTEQRRGRM